MSHFSEHAAAGRGDAFDGKKGTVRVIRVLQGRVALGIAILGGDLAVGGELGNHCVWGVEFAFAVRYGHRVDGTDFLVGEPR